jgi:5-methylcytosine-specific restriction endonuclease McrA
MRRRIYNSQTWKNVRLLVLRRDSYRCHWCGGQATEVDHLVSMIEGGSAFNPANLVAACKRCNASRGANVVNARRRGGFLLARRRSTAQGEIGDTLGAVAIFGAIREG